MRVRRRGAGRLNVKRVHTVSRVRLFNECSGAELRRTRVPVLSSFAQTGVGCGLANFEFNELDQTFRLCAEVNAEVIAMAA